MIPAWRFRLTERLTTLIKAYLQQFLLSCISCLHFSKKVTSPTKRPKAQFEETKQASEPESDMAGVLELPDQEF